MDSQIYQVIDEMFDYLASCKPKFMSSTEIVVDRDVMEEYLRDLKRKAPDEIERYRKIIRNKEAILDDARKTAQGLIDQAEVQTTELLSQNEIMKRAYEQADEVIAMANDQAQAIVDNATAESNQLVKEATDYVDGWMNYLESVIENTSQAATSQYTGLIDTLNQYGERIRTDHSQLAAQSVDTAQTDGDVQYTE